MKNDYFYSNPYTIYMIMKKLLYLCLVLTGCSLQTPDIRESTSLEGEWKFRIDSLDVGISEQWYTDMFDQTVTLPGSMTDNGMGDDVTLATRWTGNIVDRSWFTDEKYYRYRQPDNLKIPFWLKPEKHYTGAAWYQKEVIISEKWDGKRVILHLERCHWESRVFINNREAGSRNSLAVPHVYDITSLLDKGKNRISIRIDNRMVIPVGVNSHSVSDHTQTNWNGIVGRIRLETRHPVFIKNLQIYPDIQSNSARVMIALNNQSEVPFEGILELQATSFNTEKTHSAATLKKTISVSGAGQVVEVEYSLGKEAMRWSEFSPALYRMEARVKDPDGELIDHKAEDFGLRQFRANGTRFEVNGHPLFLRGTLECCIFPLTGYPPVDQASWEYVMNRCKEHGLNHIRFHSWCPPEAAFAAADNMGIYLQIECSSWANQGTSLGDGSPIDRFIYDEGDRILESYGNHPSFCMMAYGNEPGGKNQNKYLGELLDYWKSKDNRRVYTSGAGWPILPGNEFHNSPQPRIQQWGEGLGSIINASAPQTRNDYRDIISQYDVPVVSHEIGQWCVYPDFKEMDKYTGVLKPTNFEIFKETLEENHMGDQAEDFLMASGKLQALCYKAEIEAALRTPGFAGFQLLQLHDFPGQGTALVGILDPFFNSKGYISPEEFRAFCNQTVPLARMEKRIFKSSETFQAEIELAHFGEAPLLNKSVKCEIKDTSGEVMKVVRFTSKEIPVDNNTSLGMVEFKLNGMTEAGKLTLTVSISDTPFSNAWDFWVYPDILESDPGEVFITNKLDNAAKSVLAEGGSVLLLSYGDIREDKGGQVEIGFSTIFWNTAWTRGQAPHTLGILCNPDHPLLQEFPTEYHSNWQWWDPVTHSQAMILDDLPGNLKPLIQPIDTWFENRRLGLAFEARAGNGKIMVCSIDLHSGMEERPVSRQLLHSILQYMNSTDFNPEVEIGPEQVSEMLY